MSHERPGYGTCAECGDIGRVVPCRNCGEEKCSDCLSDGSCMPCDLIPNEEIGDAMATLHLQ